jgi:hypothetical protein
MLAKAGHNVVLFVNTDFRGELDDLPCEVRKIVPVFTYENYQSVASVPNSLVNDIKDKLEESLKDIDLCITHDIVLQDAFIPHNLAVRKINLPIIWRHWIHSQPNTIKINNLPKGHKLVFLNYSDRLAVAERYCIWMDEVGVVYNTISPHEYKGTNELSNQIINIFKSKEVRISYPFCTTRMGAKGVDKLLRLAGKIKNNGKSVGICLVNSNANAGKEKQAIEYMSNTAVKYGLVKNNDFIFTSTLDDLFECGLPHTVARDLFHLANVFIFPTISECCSLVLLEAMSAGNLLVLNDDIPSMKEFGGFDSALYMKFGSIWQNTNYANEDGYYNDWAKIIIRHLDTDMADKSRKRAELFNEDNIWQTQLSKLI